MLDKDRWTRSAFRTFHECVVVGIYLNRYGTVPSVNVIDRVLRETFYIHISFTPVFARQFVVLVLGRHDGIRRRLTGCDGEIVDFEVCTIIMEMLAEAGHLLIGVRLDGTVKVDSHRRLCDVTGLDDSRHRIAGIGLKIQIISPLPSIAIAIPIGVLRIVEIHRVQRLDGEIIVRLIIEVFKHHICLTCRNDRVTDDGSERVGLLPCCPTTADITLQCPFDMITRCTIHVIPVEVHVIEVDDGTVVRVVVSFSRVVVATEHRPEETVVRA